MPHFPGHRQSVFKPWDQNPDRLQGLLGKGQGQGLLNPSPYLVGPNIRPDGVDLRGRVNLIGGPNQSAIKGATSYLSSISAPGYRLPTPTSTAVAPRTFGTGGTPVADIFKGAKIGQFGARVGQPAAPSTLGGFSQFAPQAAQAQQVQGGPPTPEEAANAVAATAGQAEGPEGILDPAQSFFSRMVGEKGSGKRSDIGRSMMQAGARMMQGSTEGTFATIGHGLETGLGGYQELKEKRREESDWDEQEKRRKEIEAGIGASIGEVRDADDNITRRALTEEEEARVRAVGGAEGIALAREIRQGTKKRDAINKYGIGADSARLDLLMSYDNDKALDEVVKYAESEEGRAAREAHLVEMGYSAEVAKDASYDAASTQAVLNRGMETTIMRDGSGRLRVFHNGEYAGGWGDPTPVSATDAATLEAMKISQNWEMTGDLRKSVTENYEVLKADVQRLEDVTETIRAVNDEDLDDYFGPLGGVKATIAAWAGLEETAKIQNVKNLLEKFGIGNLADFKGAISEMELALALENAGSITQVRGLINAVLSRAMDNTIDKATTHNARAQNLDSEFLNPVTGEPVGEFFSKSSAFGFDTESLAGYATERDQIFDDWLDGATGGTVNLEAPGSDEEQLEALIATEAATRRG